MQQTCHEVLAELGVEDNPVLAMAQELERIALEDEYFVEKRLYPNVDFYSGIILKAIGIPVEMFTVIFCNRSNARMDCSLERNDQRPLQDRTPASVVQGVHQTRLSGLIPACFAKKGAEGAFFMRVYWLNRRSKLEVSQRPPPCFCTSP